MLKKTTSNHAHETLALATLLDLKYQGTHIEEAGLTKLEHVDDKLRDKLVTEFWTTFHDTPSHRGAIPPGIIFLPGAKVEGYQGFGWAPRTWLSPHKIDYPNPLNHWTGETNLLKNGLEVKYPGFLLHTIGTDVRFQILGMDQNDRSTKTPYFTFPANRNLLEWYSAKPADPTAPTFLPGIANNPKARLAIILPRPRPVERPPEICLLVEIWREDHDKGKAPRRLFNCQIIRRMHIWRDMSPIYLGGADRNGPKGSSSGGSGDNAASPHWSIIGGPLTDSSFCLGESLPPEQRWVVDGYDFTRSPPTTTSKAAVKQRNQTGTSSKSPPTASPTGRAESPKTPLGGTGQGGAREWWLGTLIRGRGRPTPVQSRADRDQAQTGPHSLPRAVTYPQRPQETDRTPEEHPRLGIPRQNTLW